MEYNFTTGPIKSKLIKFTIPIAVTLLLQQLYGAVDLLIVGNFGTSADISAVSSGFQLMNMFMNLVAGFSMGTTILLAQKIGAHKEHEAGEVIGAGIFIFMVIALFMTIFIGRYSLNLADLINAPEEALIKTSEYIKILAYGSVFLVGYNILGSIFRGLGDSKTPLFAVGIATIINIILDIILVSRYNMGASGAAIATVIAQGISVLISIVVISKRDKMFEFSIKSIKIHKEFTKQTLVLGAPVGINMFLVSVSFMFIQALVNTFGVIISAGVGITERLIGFLMLIPSSFGQSLASFTAQNVGAEEHERAKEGAKFGLLSSIAVALVIIILVLFFGDKMLSIFTKDLEIVAVAYTYLKAYCFDILFTAFLFTSLGYFNGYGKTKFTMITGIMSSFLFRIPLSYLFSLHKPLSIFFIGLATPCGTVFQLIVSYFYFKKLQEEIKDSIKLRDLN